MTKSKVWKRKKSAWVDFIEEMHSGRVFEVDEGMYFYWLEMLPPAWMNETVSTPVGERRTFGFAEGAENVVAFWREHSPTEGTRFFGWQTQIMNPDW